MTYIMVSQSLAYGEIPGFEASDEIVLHQFPFTGFIICRQVTAHHDKIRPVLQFDDCIQESSTFVFIAVIQMWVGKDG